MRRRYALSSNNTDNLKCGVLYSCEDRVLNLLSITDDSRTDKSYRTYTGHIHLYHLTRPVEISKDNHGSDYHVVGIHL